MIKPIGCAIGATLLAGAAPVPVVHHACRPTRPSLVAGSGPARARRLDELPPAAAVLLVDRRVDGCPAPLVVRTGIGAPPRPTAPARRPD